MHRQLIFAVKRHLDDLDENFDSILPSEAEVLVYKETGFYVSKRLIPSDLIDDALSGVTRFYEGDRDYVLPVQGGYLDWHPAHGDGLRINDYVSLQNESIRALVSWPLVAAAAARLSQVQQVRLFHDQLITKTPLHVDKTPVGWHIDRCYWNTCSNSDKMITAWIPLVPYTLEMGPLTVMEGSHLWSGNEWMATFNEVKLEDLERKIQAPPKGFMKRVIMISPGHVSFHSAGVIHGSLQNNGKLSRIALTVHFQDGANSYRPHVNHHGRQSLHINDVLCRKRIDGAPDYSDPDICPLLWDDEWDPTYRFTG